MFLSVIIPAKNASAGIVEAVRQVAQHIPEAEIIVVDNDSADDTAALAFQEGAKVLYEPSAGEGNAMRTGAIHATGELILFFEANGEYSVSDAAKLPHLYKSGSMVVGIRKTDPSRHVCWLSNLVHLIFSLRFRSRGAFLDPLTSMRMMSRQDFLDMNTVTAGCEINAEISCRAAHRRLTIVETDILFTQALPAGIEKYSPLEVFRCLRQCFLPRSLR